MLCKDQQYLQRCLAGLGTLNRDFDSKKLKRETVQSILDNFNKDGYIQFLQTEVAEEEQRIGDYQRTQRDLKLKAAENQDTLVNFEKVFFQALENVVINKKQQLRKWLHSEE